MRPEAEERQCISLNLSSDKRFQRADDVSICPVTLPQMQEKFALTVVENILTAALVLIIISLFQISLTKLSLLSFYLMTLFTLDLERTPRRHRAMLDILHRLLLAPIHR